MTLPFSFPVAPMLAKLTTSVPTSGNWIFEPKWDGFRAMIFRDGDNVHIQSRDLKPLHRYFPELLEPIRKQLPDPCVIDGEVVIATDGRLDFEALLLRIHPAESRIKLLAAQTPASFVAFDLLALGDRDLRSAPQEERREELEKALAKVHSPIHMTPATRDPKIAQDWFNRFEGAGLDGVMAKPHDLLYLPGKRAMIKIKHARTADCVVAGFRWYKGGRGKLVGSLLLGLYDDEKKLQHVGICASFKKEVREQLAIEFAPLREGAKESHPWRMAPNMDDTSEDGEEAEEKLEQRKPGKVSRWNNGKDLSWEPVRLERVCEVGFDNMQGRRFRHATHFKRWRPDKPVADCTYEQLHVTPALEVATIFGGSS